MVKEILFRAGYATGMHRIFKSRSGITVLCLHRISPVSDPLFPPLTPKVFAGLVRLLKKEYTITGFSEVESARKPSLVISFDDGYKDFVEYAMPVISKEKIPVNHNIVINSVETGQLIWTQRFNNLLSDLFKTGRTLDIQYEDLRYQQKPEGTVLAAKGRLFRILFQRSYPFCSGLVAHLENHYSFRQPEGEMMNWKEVVACDREGVEIGSHTMFHSSLAAWNEEGFGVTEIRDSKKVLEEKLGHPVQSIAFPNGWAHPKAYQAAIEAGYTNLLLIDGVNYDFELKPVPTVKPYKRILIGHPSIHENIFNIAGFHKALKRG
jgi:peptidoglycan/xylan/chitin deacetylase (PgdA/CDA1 family)